MFPTLKFIPLLALVVLVLQVPAALAADFPTYEVVQKELRRIIAEKNGGFGLQMWATMVNRDGEVVVVVMSGKDRGDQWPGSRVISAQKANTANSFSLPGLALSTAQLYSAVQPGGFAFGLQESNPVNTAVAYDGKAADFGTINDPMVGKRIGGLNVFGGGLPLYSKDGTLIGGLGLSGDSSVTDHIIAWKLRHALDLDHIPGGVSPTGDDNMVIDIENNKSSSGWGHPATNPDATALVNGLPTTTPIPKKK